VESDFFIFVCRTEERTMQEIKNKYSLLDARKEALEKAANGSIRPHGKLWGMDVFSWINPDIDAITSTIHSFPFPIICLATSELLMSIVEKDETILSNIHTVISYENSEVELDRSMFSEIENVQVVNDIHLALDAMSVVRLKRGVILFCSTGTDYMMYENAFKKYLELHQI
jgi:hypothetical protein